MSSMSTQAACSHLSTAPTAALQKLRPEGRPIAARVPFVGTGVDRLGFGFGSGSGLGTAIALRTGTVQANGITETGPKAHAAVRTHVVPATVAFWVSYPECDGKAPTSSAGRLRRC